MASLAICQRRGVRVALVSSRKATIVPRASMGHVIDIGASSQASGAGTSEAQSQCALVATQASTVGPRGAQAASGLDFADLLHMDERLVYNCLQDAVTYRTLVGCDDELTKRPGQAASFNVKSATSFRDNVTRNLAPVVARGLANHARGKGLRIPAAAACSSAFEVQTPEPNSPKCASGGMVEAVILQQQKQFELQQQQLQQLRQQQRDRARGAVWYPGSGVGAAHVMFRQLASAHTAPQQQSVLAASG